MVHTTGSYVKKRELTARYSLAKGAYVIIPSCQQTNIEDEFLLRIFIESPFNKKYKLFT